MSFTRETAALAGKIGAYAQKALHDPRELTANARATFLTRFEREVDPAGTLPPAERQRRAEYARKAHFARLALKSARIRAQKKAAVGAAAEEVRDVPARSSI
jgi:hypothetical protein